MKTIKEKEEQEKTKLINFCEMTDEEINQYVVEQNMKDPIYRLAKNSEPIIKHVFLGFMVLFTVFTTVLGYMAFKLFPISMAGGYITLAYMGVCIAFATVFKKKAGY